MLGLLALLSACGGGSRPSHVQVEQAIASEVTVDGYVTDTGFVVQAQRPLTGDDEVNQVARAFFRFPHPALPAGSEIVRATFVVGQEGGAGTPYTNLGSVVVDHVDLGAILDASDFDATALTTSHGTLSTDATLEAKSLDITALVQADRLAGRTQTDLRLRFEISGDSDATADFAIWNDAAGSGHTGALPLVMVIVRVPVP